MYILSARVFGWRWLCVGAGTSQSRSYVSCLFWTTQQRHRLRYSWVECMMDWESQTLHLTHTLHSYTLSVCQYIAHIAFLHTLGMSVHRTRCILTHSRYVSTLHTLHYYTLSVCQYIAHIAFLHTLGMSVHRTHCIPTHSRYVSTFVIRLLRL